MKRCLELVPRLAATLLCAGMLLAASVPVFAAAGGPEASSTTLPTPYSWPAYHAGGLSRYPLLPPATAVTPTGANNPITGSLLPARAPNPLYSQLQGTPSGFNPVPVTATSQSYLTEIPSFVIGNYDPTFPPGPVDTTGFGIGTSQFPNHFLDDTGLGSATGIISISAPFTFTTPTAVTDPAANVTVVLDDDNANNPPGGTAAFSSGWTTQPSNPPTPNTTANNGFYQRVLVSPPTVDVKTNNVTAVSTETVTYTFPAVATGGQYSLAFHLPDPTDAENRIPDAHYVVKNLTTGTTLFDERISQTETNDPQYLAGPFVLAVNDVVTVTLDNSTLQTVVPTPNTNFYVLADSVSLLPGATAGSGNTIRSSPAAINATEFPEIANAFYYGRSNTITAATPDQGLPDAVPFGNTMIDTTISPTILPVANGGPADKFHAIRQLVYFGRSEKIVLVDKTGNATNGHLVDANGASVSVPVTQTVGAIYCMDGQTGGVVWRFQTPDILDPKTGKVAFDVNGKPRTSAPTFSTPAVARLNVQTSAEGVTPVTYATKLCVITADDNGFVYCLDAIGNRNGTSNSLAITQPYNQPRYVADAPFNPYTLATPPTSATATVGTTRPYWIYRPDAANANYAAYGGFAAIQKNLAAALVPAPLAFGMASPTVYVNPDIGIDPTTLAPGAPGSAQDSSAYLTTLGTVTVGPKTIFDPALIDNGRVYIGNSNGTLYNLDALGADPLTETATGVVPSPNAAQLASFNSSLPISNAAQQIVLDTVPTPLPVWWFPLNGAATPASAADLSGYSITSTPSILQTDDASGTTTSLTASYTIYISSVANVNGPRTVLAGRVYAVPSTGPTSSVTGATLKAGAATFNTEARPQWSFPRAYVGTGSVPTPVRPALGDISGSPVVFVNPDDATPKPSLYFAANLGLDGLPAKTLPDTQHGRIWSVDAATGTANWAYPDTVDPNSAITADPDTGATAGGLTLNKNAVVADPIGAFANATPAIGVVQFPAVITYGETSPATDYKHPDHGNPGAAARSDIRGQRVPMLYVGSATEAPDGTFFYMLDLDGQTDGERNIWNLTGADTPAPFGTPIFSTSGILSSPLLVTNYYDNSTAIPSAPFTPGSGGVVFVTVNEQLYELQATPTDAGVATGITQPQFIFTDLLGGFGSFSSPAIAAYDSTDLRLPPGQVGFFATAAATDWVYGCSSGSGFAIGITPGDRTNTGGIDPTINPPFNPVQPPVNLPNVAMHTYIFDNQGTGAAKHDAESPDMGKANKIGEALPVFEWGGNVYFRLSNVVPPNSPTGGLGPAGNPRLWVTDGSNTGKLPTTLPATPTAASVQAAIDSLAVGDKIITNGSFIDVYFSPVDAAGQAVSASQPDKVRVPAKVITTLMPTSGLPIPEGFIRETAPPTTATPPTGQYDIVDASGQGVYGDVLTDYTGSLYVGAATYPIGDGSGKNNTPGARRRVTSALQTAQAYEVLDDPANPGIGQHILKFVSGVKLDVSVNGAANTVATSRRGPGPGGPGTGRPLRRRILPTDQPTFGILNPLAIRGGGAPIPLGVKLKLYAQSIGRASDGLLGPFHGVPFNGTSLSIVDVDALANGNRIYRDVNQIPRNGILTGDRGAGRLRNVNVITATSEISHGSTGDNGDPDHAGQPPPTSDITTSSSAYRIFQPAGIPISNYGGYTLNVADRSVLGMSSYLSLKKLTVEDGAPQWNDNNDDNVGTNAANGKEGLMARVNPLPWEDLPTGFGAGANASQDYPNIPARAVRSNLVTRLGAVKPMTGRTVSPDAATGGASPDYRTRTINTDGIQIQVSVPKYQPANLQIYDQTTSPDEATPDKLLHTSVAFPMGYVVDKKIYIDTNNNNRCDDNEAQRVVRVFVGVPVDMSTAIVNQTTDLGKLPHSFGIQIDGSPLDINSYGFSPYDTSYAAYFKPVTVLNQGNVNLLNVQFNQRLLNVDQTGVLPTSVATTPLAADAIDPLISVPDYDLAKISGPRFNLPSSGTPLIFAQPFLLRTSLDADLVQAYGRNPGIIANATLSAAYPGATFHKARVGDGSPSLLTVPDIPRNASNLLSSDTPQLVPSPSNAAQLVPAQSYLPYVGLAVPLGTPVGNYAEDLQVFEGIDPDTYVDLYALTAQNGGTLYKPLLPPQYGGIVVDSAKALTGTPYNALVQETINAPAGSPTPTVAVHGQPVSTPTRVRVSVIESRVTDGATYGALPQADAAPAKTSATGTLSPTADFGPAAFRDVHWSGGAIGGSGNVSLYWTSARGDTQPDLSVTNPTPPYNIMGANLPFNAAGYFTPAAAKSNWFGQGFLFTNLLAPGGVNQGINTNISVAAEQHVLDIPSGNFNSNGSAYAFVQNSRGLAGTAYQNTINCYELVPGSGARNGTVTTVTTDTSASHFGVRGLNFPSVTDFTDALDPTSNVTNNLWAFWNTGTRGRSAIFYSSTTKNALKLIWNPTAALPLPAGLSAASDPSAVLVPAPDGTGKLIHAIEITYSATNADGNADIYVSRYRPYFGRDAKGILAFPRTVGLALAASPPITQQLLPDTGRQYFQARDVSWARNETPSGASYKGQLNVYVDGLPLLRDHDPNQPPNQPLYDYSKTPGLLPIRETYDRASGTLIFTNVSLKGSAGGGTIVTVYVDLARGRVRFSNGITPGNNITATFEAQARRITTDTRADTEPVAFLDEAFKTNEAPNVTGTGLSPRVQTARSWYIWRKSGAPGTTTTPTLWSKTQRLTLYLHDANNDPVSLHLDPAPFVTGGPPRNTPTGLSLTDNSAAPLKIASADLLAAVDVDWVHGRLYFPLQIKGIPTEGHTITATFDYYHTPTAALPAKFLAGNVTDNVRWTDELRFGDTNNQPSTVVSIPGPTGTNSVFVPPAADTTEHAVPIDIAANEGSVSAFLDPLAYADVSGGAYNPLNIGAGLNNPDQPHKVWLFWNSTRNGTSDVYYETIAPRFSASP